MGGDQVSEPIELFGRRKYARVPVSVPVVGRAPQFSRDAITGMVRNVGCGGLMADFAIQMVDGGTLSLALQTRWGPLEVEGKVVWIAASEGKIRHGIVFPDPKEQDFAVGLFAAGSP